MNSSLPDPASRRNTGLPAIGVHIDIGHGFTKSMFSFPVSQTPLRFSYEPLKWPGHVSSYALPSVVTYVTKIGQDGLPFEETYIGYPGSFTNSRDAVEVYANWKLPALEEGPSFSIDSESRRSNKEAVTLLHDYLRMLLDVIRKQWDFSRPTMAKDLPKFDKIIIEFHFAFPSLVKEQGRRRLEQAAISAGFRTDNHSVSVVLTEAEASAIYAALEFKFDVKHGQNWIIMDIGHGTSDLSQITIDDETTMKIVKKFSGSEASKKHGGSYFLHICQKRMEEHLRQLSGSFENGQTAAGSAYNIRLAKRFFDTLSDLDPMLSIKVPGLKADARNTSNVDGMWVEAAELKTDSGVMSGMLDLELRGHDPKDLNGGILGMLTTAFDDVTVKSDSKHGDAQSVFTIVVVGGLGASKYVCDRIRRLTQEKIHDELKNIGRHEVTKDTTVRQVSEPQLSVALGLARSWCQRMETGTTPIPVEATWISKFKDLFRKDGGSGSQSQ